MCKQNRCLRVKNGDPWRLTYETAKEALQRAHSDMMSGISIKLAAVRYCPDCNGWHITTSPGHQPGVNVPNLEVLEIFVAEDTTGEGKYSDLDLLAEQAEKKLVEMKYILEVLKPMTGENLKAMPIGKLYGYLMSPKMDEVPSEVHDYITRRLSYNISRVLKDISGLLQSLEYERSDSRRKTIISTIESRMNWNSYVFVQYPEYKDYIMNTIEEYS